MVYLHLLYDQNRNCTDVDIIVVILAGAAVSNNLTVFAQEGNTFTLEYVIPIFLAMVFAAVLFSSKTKIPHTMIRTHPLPSFSQ